jgi:hypothetical protein
MIWGLPAYILGSVQIFIEDLWARLATLNSFIEGYFGPPGKWAFWILATTTILMLVGKAAKLTFNIMRYVLLPSAALSVVLVMFMPCWPPMKTFPMFVAATSVMMLFRNDS